MRAGVVSMWCEASECKWRAHAPSHVTRVHGTDQAAGANGSGQAVANGGRTALSVNSIGARLSCATSLQVQRFVGS